MGERYRTAFVNIAQQKCARRYFKMSTGKSFGIEDCEPKTHNLLPIQNGAVCTLCGKRFYWEVHANVKREPTLREAKPWRAKPHLMQ